MTRNMGNTDRIIRFALGALLIILAITGTIGWWGWIGLILLGTAFVSFCPAYRLLGMNTCGTN